MDLRRRLSDLAFSRPHVLLVAAPGHRRLTWAVEAELDRRRWPVATSPADADLVLVVGEPGPDLARAVAVLAAQVPEPAARVHVGRTDDIGRALARGLARVGTADLRGTRPDDDETGHDRTGGDGSDPWAALAGPQRPDPDSDDVAGLPMADYAEDRDGLELEALRVTLGPWLPGWPTGLVVTASLQGDVLTDVGARWLTEAPRSDAPPPEGTAGGPGDGDDAWEGPRPQDAARLVALDGLARVLLVAGWPRQARLVRRARTAVLEQEPDAAARCARVARTVGRSRLLAWSLRGVGPDDLLLARVRHGCAVAAGEPPRPRDHDRDDNRDDDPDDDRDAGGRDGGDEAPAGLGDLLRLPGLLTGTDLGTARLLVAGLGLDPSADLPAPPAPGGAEGPHPVPTTAGGAR